MAEICEIYSGDLKPLKILNHWYSEFADKNCGAFVDFIGIVRAENGINGLSFDIYEPILQNWLNAWQKKAENLGAFVRFAHSKGDVAVHKCSFVCAIISPKRAVALSLINEFVEDFKANAPIWKYDLIGGERKYALGRSTKLKGAGILG